MCGRHVSNASEAKQKYSAKITKITGITNEDVKESPSVEEVLPVFYAFIGHLPLVAHNTPFDKSFLDAYSPEPPKNKTDDTLAIVRRKLKKEKKGR
ncbi:3'-5' exonuclease (plasmid) [Bacillus megaterium]|nr:3'-5' exonuclease [Priestia megaterium]